MLESRLFVVRPRMADLLRFFVEESLRNGDAAISQRLIATHALALPGDFRPTKSSYVRSHVTRLRRALAAYYATVGRDDPLVFSITPGPYRLVVTENRPVEGTGDAPPRHAPTPPADHWKKPCMLVIEPDDALCLGPRRGIGRDVAVGLGERLVDSPFVRASGPLLRSRLAAEMLTVETAARLWDYDYCLDATLGPAADEGLACGLVLIHVPHGRRILDETTTIGDVPAEARADAVANWLFHRISAAFMRLRIDAGSGEIADDDARPGVLANWSA